MAKVANTTHQTKRRTPPRLKYAIVYLPPNHQSVTSTVITCSVHTVHTQGTTTLSLFPQHELSLLTQRLDQLVCIIRLLLVLVCWSGQFPNINRWFDHTHALLTLGHGLRLTKATAKQCHAQYGTTPDCCSSQKP